MSGRDRAQQRMRFIVVTRRLGTSTTAFSMSHQRSEPQ